MFATVDTPALRQSTFTSMEQDIGDMWHGVLKKEMMEAAAEERRLIIEQ